MGNNEIYIEGFYSEEFPRLAAILKQNLCTLLDQKNIVSAEEYINVFLEYFERYSAYSFFKEYNICNESMSISIASDNSGIYFERNFEIENVSDEYQIIFDLYIDKSDEIVFVDGFPKSYSVNIERDEKGCIFLNWTDEIVSFSNFKDSFFRDEQLNKILKLYPKSIELSLNVDNI